MVGVPKNDMCMRIASFWPVGLFLNNKTDIVEMAECFESSKAFIFTGEGMAVVLVTKASKF